MQAIFADLVAIQGVAILDIWSVLQHHLRVGSALEQLGTLFFQLARVDRSDIGREELSKRVETLLLADVGNHLCDVLVAVPSINPESL